MTISEASGEIKIRVDQVTAKVKQQMERRAVRASNALRNAEQDVLFGQRHGQVRYKPGGGKYTASAPGEAPAKRLGPLRRDWNFVPAAAKSVSGGVQIIAAISSATPYADYLDSGTRKMAARPFVEKIKTKALPKIKAIYSEPYT